MIRAVDRALSALEITMIVVLTLAGLAMAFVQVILRYVFNTGVHWLEAGLVTALVWAMLFGAVRAVRTGRIRVSICCIRWWARGPAWC